MNLILMQLREEELNKNYYSSELDKLNTEQTLKCKISDGETSTKTLDLNEECIKEMIARLEQILAKHY